MRYRMPGVSGRPGSRAAAALLAITGLTTAALAAPAAEARPPIGPVKNLSVVVTRPTTSYRLAVDWADLAGAVSYDVTLTTAAGTVISSDQVTRSDWVTTTNRPATTVVRVTITPRTSTRKGRPTTISKTLPDLSAPVASYSVAWSGVDATVTQSLLVDDVTPADSIKREINWGETGGAFELWPTGTSVSHGYPVQDGRYVPQVRLTDGAGNVATLTLHAVVIGDTTPPSGTYAATPPTRVWAKYTPVTVTQSALSDDFSPANKVDRVVTWGDGTVSPWLAGLAINHVYAKGGTFTPVVSLADEAGNTTTSPASAITVLVDAAAPKVALTVPKTGTRLIRSWAALAGKAVDAGVGVRYVQVRAIEKRGSSWYAYRPALKKWVNGGSTAAAAWKLAGTARVAPNSAGVWKSKLGGLRRGTLVVRYNAVDKVANSSKWLVRKQLLVRY
jgi:hypothetical protein